MHTRIHSELCFRRWSKWASYSMHAWCAIDVAHSGRRARTKNADNKTKPKMLWIGENDMERIASSCRRVLAITELYSMAAHSLTWAHSCWLQAAFLTLLGEAFCLAHTCFHGNLARRIRVDFSTEKEWPLAPVLLFTLSRVPQIEQLMQIAAWGQPRLYCKSQSNLSVDQSKCTVWIGSMQTACAYMDFVQRRHMNAADRLRADTISSRLAPTANRHLSGVSHNMPT